MVQRLTLKVVQGLTLDDCQHLTSTLHMQHFYTRFGGLVINTWRCNTQHTQLCDDAEQSGVVFLFCFLDCQQLVSHAGCCMALQYTPQTASC